jgi:predicted nucleic acid-binding protein
MPFVLDASVAASWAFADEGGRDNPGEVSARALDFLAHDHAVVPALWWFELRNILVVNERRGRIDTAGTAAFLLDLDQLPIRIDRTPDSTAVVALARQHRLTAYDAAYLELARRLSLPLATLDAQLLAAALKDGVREIE